MFIGIGDYLINSDDIRWLNKGQSTIEVAFKNESDVNSIEVEYDNKDELEAENNEEEKPAEEEKQLLHTIRTSCQACF